MMIDGRTYSVHFKSVAATAIKDLIELASSSGNIVELLSARCGQDTDYADARAEGSVVSLVRYATTGGAGAATVRKHNLATGSATTGVKQNLASQGGTPTPVLSEAWNIQSGWLYLPVPEERIWMGPGEFLSLVLDKNPSESISISAAMTWKEYEI